MARKKRKVIPDYLDDPRASQQLAKDLTMYWTKRGYHDVRFHVEKQMLPGNKLIHVIRSNVRIVAPKE